MTVDVRTRYLYVLFLGCVCVASANIRPDLTERPVISQRSSAPRRKLLRTCSVLGSNHRRRDTRGLPVSYVNPEQTFSLTCQCPGILGNKNILWTIKRSKGAVVNLPEVSTRARVEVDDASATVYPKSSIHFTVLSENELGTVCCHQRGAWPGCMVLTAGSTWNMVHVVVKAQQKQGSRSDKQKPIYTVYCNLIALMNDMLYGSMTLLVNSEERELQSAQIVRIDDYYRATRWEKRYRAEELVHNGNRLQCRWTSTKGTTILSKEITVQMAIESTAPPSHVSQLVSSTPSSLVSAKAYKSDDEDIDELKYSGDDETNEIRFVESLEAYLSHVSGLVPAKMYESDDEDSGQEDSGQEYSGAEDSGEEYSGEEDSGEEYSGTEDSGEEYSGTEDSGEEYSGTDDSGEEDSGKEYSGEEYSREEDSGEDYSGTEDSGEEISEEEYSREEGSGGGVANQFLAGEDTKSDDEKGNQVLHGEDRNQLPSSSSLPSPASALHAISMVQPSSATSLSLAGSSQTRNSVSSKTRVAGFNYEFHSSLNGSISSFNLTGYQPTPVYHNAIEFTIPENDSQLQSELSVVEQKNTHDSAQEMIVIGSVVGTLVAVSIGVVLVVAVRRVSSRRRVHSFALVKKNGLGLSVHAKVKKDLETKEIEMVNMKTFSKETSVLVDMRTLGDALQAVEVNIQGFSYSPDMRAHGVLFNWESPTNEMLEDKNAK